MQHTFPPFYHHTPSRSPRRGIAWSTVNAALLASCSSDRLVHVYNTATRKRLVSVDVQTHASMIRFPRTDENLLATVHGRDVRVWNIQSPSMHVYSFQPHIAPVADIDFRPFTDEIVTCCSNASEATV